MYNKKLLERFISSYDYSRRLMEFDIRTLVKEEDFFMIEQRAKEWKRYNIIKCELEKILEDLEKNKSINDILYIYNEHDKMHRTEILKVLMLIRDSTDYKISLYNPYI
jgi:hypothetical protein